MSEHLILFLFFLFIAFFAFLLLRVIKRYSFRYSFSDKKRFLRIQRNILMEKDLRNQIIGFDKLLHECLKKRNYTGSLGEILRKSRKLFTDYKGIRTAHHLRNKIAHDLDFAMSSSDAKKAISSFIRAFKDLGL